MPQPVLTSSRLAASLMACAACMASLGAMTPAAPPAAEPMTQPKAPADGPAPKEEGAPQQTPPASPTPPSPSRPAGSVGRDPVVRLLGFTQVRGETSPRDDQDLVTLGRLTFARVDVECDDATVGASIRALTDALGVNVAMKFDVQFTDDTPVFLSLKNVDGIAALEAIIAQGGSAATWQLRRGILEIGSRTFLARPGARRTEVYDISSLVFDTSMLPNTSQGRAPFQMGSDAEAYRRKAPAELAADLMQAIMNQVEVEAWQPLPQGDGSGGTAGPTPRMPQTGGSANHGQRNQAAAADRNFDAGIGPPFVRGKWATMEYYKPSAQLMVAAPDFVHRGIVSYPPALPVAGGPALPASPTVKPGS